MRRICRRSWVRRSAFTLLELLVCIAIIAVLVAILLPAIQQSREAARRSQCQNNLRQLTLGLAIYHDAHDVLPAGTTGTKSPVQLDVTEPHFSWTIRLLPYIEQQSLHDRVDYVNDTVYAAVGETYSTGEEYLYSVERMGMEDGGGKHARPNQFLHDSDMMPPLFSCPSSVLSPPNSNYVGLHHHEPKPIGDEDSGLLFLNSSIDLDDIPDGRSVTAILSETVLPAAIDWSTGTRSTLRYPSTRTTAVDRWSLSNITFSLRDSIDDPNVLIADYGVTGDYQDFASMLSDFSLSSSHSGGFHVAFADGRVTFFGESRGVGILQTVTNRHDAAPLSEF